MTIQKMEFTRHTKEIITQRFYLIFIVKEFTLHTKEIVTLQFYLIFMKGHGVLQLHNAVLWALPSQLTLLRTVLRIYIIICIQGCIRASFCKKNIRIIISCKILATARFAPSTLQNLCVFPASARCSLHNICTYI